MSSPSRGVSGPVPGLAATATTRGWRRLHRDRVGRFDGRLPVPSTGRSLALATVLGTPVIAYAIRRYEREFGLAAD